MHDSDKDEYEGPPWFAGIEYQKSRNTVIGLSVFNNSFGEFTLGIDIAVLSASGLALLVGYEF